MSVSSAQRVRTSPVKSAYATNWPAVWGISGIVVLFMGVAIARQFWPTPAPEIEPTRVAFRQPALVATNPQRHAALVALQPTIELAAAEPTLDVVLRPAPTPRASIAKAKTAGISDSRNKPTPDEETASLAADERPVTHKLPTKPSGLNARLEEGWLAAADSRNPDDLAFDLQDHSVELDLLSLPGVVRTVPSVGRSGQKINSLVLADSAEVPELASRHQELAGLPFRRGDECRKSPSDAQQLKRDAIRLHCVVDGIQLARERRHLAGSPDEEFRAVFEPRSTREPRESPLGRLLKTDPSFRRPDAAPILVQMLQPMEAPVRVELIGGLSAIDSPAASAALAERAIYDLSPQVRGAARNELRNRPEREYREQLLAGLRYPWAPVAIHAAEAIIALNLQEAIPELNGLLALPDPNLPHQDEAGRWIKTDLVRVNHLRSCYLCHAASNSTSDPIRGSVPTPGERVAPVYSRDEHQGFIRADVTYLKQDFSVVQEVAKTEPWPMLQRFDYIARTREATLSEIALANSPETIEERSQEYPQRVAVLNALQGLLETAADAPTERTATRRDKRLRSP